MRVVAVHATEVIQLRINRLHAVLSWQVVLLWPWILMKMDVGRMKAMQLETVEPGVAPG
jgi:hypothetical protein